MKFRKKPLVIEAVPALESARHALKCLRLEVSRAVHEDVTRKVEAAFAALQSKNEATNGNNG